MRVALAHLAILLLCPSFALAQSRPKISSVSHLTVYTSDVAKSELFYVHDLGAFKGDDPQNKAGVRYYFNSLQFVEVLPLLPDLGEPRSRFDHAGFNTSDAEGLRKYLSAKKIHVPDSVTKSSDGSQYFDVLDPEGNRVQFIQPSEHPARVPLDALSSHMIHVGYIVHSSAVEDAFYIKVLGFRSYWHGGPTDDSSDWISIQLPDGMDWLEYMTVKGSESTGIPASMTQDVAGILDHFALGIKNVEQTYTELYSENRLNGKHSNPQLGRDGKWQLNIYDPDGTRAELMEFQPVAKPCCSPFLLPSPDR